MKQTVFNCLKRLAVMLIAVLGFSTASFAQEEHWGVEFISDPLSDPSWTGYDKEFDFEITDPYYCTFPGAEDGKILAKYKTKTSALNGDLTHFPCFINNGDPNGYFAVKTYLTAGNYQFSYRIKKTNRNTIDGVDLFYTSDLNGSRNYVLTGQETNKNVGVVFESTIFEITEDGFYYLGFCCSDTYYSGDEIFFADFRMYREGGAPVVPEFFDVTLNQTGNGTVVVKKDGSELTLPAQVEAGTTLTVEATADGGYELTSLTAAGVDIMSSKSFVVNGNTEINAVFTENGPVAPKSAINIPGTDFTNHYMVRFDDDELGSHTPGDWTSDTRTKNITMSAWVKVNELTTSDYDSRNIFAWGQKAFYGAEGTFYVKVDKEGKLTLVNRYFTGDPAEGNYGDSKSYLSVSDFNVAVGTWYFVTVVFDNDNKTSAVYVDGKLRSEKLIDGFGLCVLPDDAVLSVGNGDSKLDVQEVQVWKKALNPVEVFESMYNVDAAAEDLAYLYRFAEENKSGNAYTNLAGGNVTASLVSGTINGINYVDPSEVAANQVEGHPEVVKPATYTVAWTAPAVAEGTLSVKYVNSVSELVSPVTVVEGSVLEVVATPAGENVIKSLTYTVADGEAQNIDGGKITVTGNTTIAVEFEALPSFDVTVADGIENGEVTLTVDGAPVEGPVQQKKTVNVNVVPAKDFKLATLTYSVEGNDGLQNVDIKDVKSFTVEGKTTVNATFVALQNYEVKLADGIANGTVTLKVDGAAVEGPVQEGKTVTVEYEPAAGYAISALTYSVADGAQDVDIMTSKSFVVEGNTTVNAEFALTNYKVTWTAENGTLAVKYVNAESEEVDVESGVTEIPAGSTIKVVPAADTENGYILKSLSYQLGEGAAENLTEEPYEFVLTDDATLNVVFGYPSLKWGVANTYSGWATVSISTVEDGDIMKCFEGAYSAGSQNGEVQIPAGRAVTVSAVVPESKISEMEVRVYLDGEEVELNEDGVYTFDMPAENSSLEFKYDDIKYLYNITKEGEGEVKIATGDNFGNVSGAESGFVTKKESEFKVLAEPAEGWKTESLEVLMGGEPATPTAEGVYTATADMEINVKFAIYKYTLNIVQPEEGATISVKVKGEDEALENNAVVDYGTELEISVETEEGYEVEYLNVNSSSQDVDYETGKYYYVAGTDGYDETTLNISTELKLKKYKLEVNVENADVLVRAESGVIKPGVKAVEYGQELTIAIAPKSGYTVKSLSVNDNVLTAGTDGTYTHKVEGDVVITAVVEEATSIDNVAAGKVYYSAAEEVLYSDSAKSVRVYDLSGRLVLNAENQDAVSVAELSEGIYTAVVDGTVVKFNK